MSGSTKLCWMGLGALLMTIVVAGAGGIVYLTVDRASRGPVPPPHLRDAYPWGALDLDELQTDPDSPLQRSIAASMHAESPTIFDLDQDGIREYDLLALSGGGANGAFGAGIPVWVDGCRVAPDFKVVTGVSTGALQATFAFLGSDYDDELKQIYTEYDTSDIYRRRGVLAGLCEDALWSTAPLAGIIASYVDDDVLAAVAAKHAAGHRLFVGTTNMDTREFVVWDLGAIASSGRPDALEHYRRILLASASIPVLFPPVYFTVNDGEDAFSEMHVDGGAHAQVFFRGFLLDFEDASVDAGAEATSAEVTLYVIRNGQRSEDRPREAVDPRALSIVSVTIESMFDITMGAGLYRMYVLASRYGIDFNIAEIPSDYAGELDPMIFDIREMNVLFQTAYDLAASGYAWRKAPSGLDPDELFEPPVRTPAGP